MKFMSDNNFGRSLREIRKQKSLTVNQLAMYSGVSSAQISRIENGLRGIPKPETIRKLSDALKYPYEDLLRKAGHLVVEESNEIYSAQLTNKDQKDIAKRIEQIKHDMENADGLAFDGEPMSDEAMESFLEAMEYVVSQTKRINKKYTPKKYRRNNSNE